MKNFLRSLPYKPALMVYTIVLLVLSLVGRYLEYGWYGFKFSTPIILTVLIIDLLLTYKLYKKRWKN
jgi:hypothetical protein